ncbi:MAG: carboxymuconolactone decarboxylase family protein [Spirulinaceae cyanobacterium RM2_2_10]|nr:carboxymuconolactone decarboxylase family protein [Spirulinaceae cyanobacterium SM2_1_0]NJO19552.1 carboxymuconolactone decarboxylase family protein [Spirulinaceae cyanobacterium RM2_2_10]
MTPTFPIHTPDTAPNDSKEILRHTEKSFGMIPNLEGVMATSPCLLKSYSSMWDEFENTTLTPVERQVVYQTANFENTCNYCVPWHSLLSCKAGMDALDIEALRQGMPLSNSKHEALRVFTKEVVLQRGKISKGAIDLFLQAGYTAQNVLEVIMGIAIKTMSNYTNSIAGTPLDKQVQQLAWKKPLADG